MMAAFDWKEYYSIATELKSSTDESKRRTAISRGYYFAYHRTRRMVGPTSGRYIKHEDLISNLSERNSRLANQLQGLKQVRVQADYEAFNPVSMLVVQNFFARLDQFLKGVDEENDQ